MHKNMYKMYIIQNSVIKYGVTGRMFLVKAQLILENGERYSGEMFGEPKDVVGEVIFTTGMTGYQETFTDSSYAGQILTMTFPMIGNYGINDEDMLSDKVSLKAVIMREKCDSPSNFRSKTTLDEFLKEQGVTALCGIDTRVLTKSLRDNGIMKGVIMKGEPSDEEVKNMLLSFDNKDLVMSTTVTEEYEINTDGNKHIACLDLGAKDAILKELTGAGYRVTIMPANVSAEEILKKNPDYLLLTEGPGSPFDIPEITEEVKKLLGKLPVVGIGLGHQVLALAMGCAVTKLKFGHHGANQPVKDLSSGRVYVTSQNHNYIVENLKDGVVNAYVNVNDGTCEGIFNKELKALGVQFRPERAPGDFDIDTILKSFLGEVK